MAHLTILTPTWNRCHLLSRVYDSLISQEISPGSIEWMVVDDGSTDGSSNYIRNLQSNAPFPIRLIVQDNGGKHRALNRGIQEISSQWLLVLDSDDWMLSGGIRDALSQINTWHNDAMTQAIIAPMVFTDRPSPTYAMQSKPINFATWRSKYFRSDFSMVVRTNIMRNHPFPEFAGEKFISESAVYSRAFARGGVRMTNTPIMGAEYQDDGLSLNVRHIRVNSPRGAMYTYLGQIDAGLNGLLCVRMFINYYRFYWHARAIGTVPNNERSFEWNVWCAAGWFAFANDCLKMGRRLGRVGPDQT